jgi:hypothetical protein
VPAEGVEVGVAEVVRLVAAERHPQPSVNSPLAGGRLRVLEHLLRHRLRQKQLPPRAAGELPRQRRQLRGAVPRPVPMRRPAVAVAADDRGRPVPG